MKKLINQLALATMIALPAFAESTGGGNGGDVLICKNPAKNMILDYFEGIDKGLYKSFGSPAFSVKENFDLWVANLAKVDYARSKFFREIGTDILQQIKDLESGKIQVAKFVNFTDSELIDIPDSQELIIPKNCQKQQLVIQTNATRGEKWLKIQKDLWTQLDNVQKAIIITHELVYYDFILANNAKDSRDARYFNQLVMADAFSGMSVCDYFKFLGTHLPDTKMNLQNQNGTDFISLEPEKMSCEGDHFQAINKNDSYKIKISHFNLLTFSQLKISSAETSPFESEDLFPEIGILDAFSTIYGGPLKTSQKGSFNFEEAKFIAEELIKQGKPLQKNLLSEANGTFKLTAETKLKFNPKRNDYYLSDVLISLEPNHCFLKCSGATYQADLYFSKEEEKITAIQAK